jgi:hypothetical protein
MTIDELVEQVGSVVTGQVSVAWDTRQTAGQWVEIQRDGGDSEDITLDLFLEYVRSNTADVLLHDTEAGLISIMAVYDHDGFAIEEQA